MMVQDQAAPAVSMDVLYQTHVRRVYGFIYAHVGNREAAEDLTSEVFLRAVAHLDPTRAQDSIAAWLYRVAHNAVNDYWRVAQRAPVIALDEARALRSPRPAHDHARQEQTAARATTLLQRLPANYRQVLTYRLLEGMSVAETAARMGISEGNVKVLQHRALERAAALREEGRPA